MEHPGNADIKEFILKIHIIQYTIRIFMVIIYK